MHRHIINFLLLFIFCSLQSSLSIAATITLPKTGQTSCWDTVQTPLASCTGTGQDGELQVGKAWPNPRFSVNADQTVTDNLTGLFWSKNSSPAGRFQTWQDSLDYIKTLNNQKYLGYSDWRMPNVNELRSLANSQPVNLLTWLDSQGFSRVQSDYYWSSTTNAYVTKYARVVDMRNGTTTYINKISNYYIWPVRGRQLDTLTLYKTGQTACYDADGTDISCAGTGQDGELQEGAAWPSQRFSTNTDQTVTDNLTGLIWTKDANPASGTNSWQQALDYIKTLNLLNYLGHNNWRLPNRDELASLLNWQQIPPATWLNSQDFSNVQVAYYWSSTTIPSSAYNAWGVSMGSGFIYVNYKSDNSYVWPVYGGQLTSNSLTDGSCGDSSNKTLIKAPTANLCAPGTASTVAGTGPWSWTCVGGNGGTTATCSANKAQPGDCDNSGTITIAEVQSGINMFLGLKPVEACVDQDGAGGVSIAEVQKVINSFLGL